LANLMRTSRGRLAPWSRETLRTANSGARKSPCLRKMGLRRDSPHPILALHRKAVPWAVCRLVECNCNDPGESPDRDHIEATGRIVDSSDPSLFRMKASRIYASAVSLRRCLYQHREAKQCAGCQPFFEHSESHGRRVSVGIDGRHCKRRNTDAQVCRGGLKDYGSAESLTCTAAAGHE